MIVKHIGQDERVRHIYCGVERPLCVHDTIIAIRIMVPYVNTEAGYVVSERPNTLPFRLYDTEKTVALINLAPGEVLEIADEPARS